MGTKLCHSRDTIWSYFAPRVLIRVLRMLPLTSVFVTFRDDLYKDPGTLRENEGPREPTLVTHFDPSARRFLIAFRILKKSAASRARARYTQPQITTPEFSVWSHPGTVVPGSLYKSSQYATTVTYCEVFCSWIGMAVCYPAYDYGP